MVNTLDVLLQMDYDSLQWHESIGCTCTIIKFMGGCAYVCHVLTHALR